MGWFGLRVVSKNAPLILRKVKGKELGKYAAPLFLFNIYFEVGCFSGL